MNLRQKLLLAEIKSISDNHAERLEIGGPIFSEDLECEFFKFSLNRSGITGMLFPDEANISDASGSYDRFESIVLNDEYVFVAAFCAVLLEYLAKNDSDNV